MNLHTNLIGRFGNQLFQYCAARKQAEMNGWSLSTPPWVGERIFDIPEAPRRVFPDKVFEGYGQRQQDLTYSRLEAVNWLRLKPEIKAKLDSFVPQGEMLAHIRRGDYAGYQYPLVSKQSYFDAADGYGFNPINLKYVSEEEPLTHPDFTGDLAFLPDFYRMMRAKVLFRANSSFSWWASVLGEALTFSPCIKDKPGGVESRCVFDWGNAQRLANLEFTTDLHLFHEEQRYDYALTPDSLVIDVGGYNGDFADKIHRRYNCRVDIYEPCAEFFARIQSRFDGNAKVQVFRSAVSNAVGNAVIRVKGDMTGVYAEGPAENAPTIDAVFLPDADMLKLNCEGGEFEILESILDCGEAHRFKSIQVQFHSVVPDAHPRYIRIRDGLLKTHRPTFQAPWCWEGFELR